MKKNFGIANLLLMLIALALCVYYDIEGGLLLKGITSAAFVVLGAVNLVYAMGAKVKNKAFPLILALGLLISMIGDVALNVHFITGALIFVLGHVCYFIAYCVLRPWQTRDLLPIGIIGTATVLLVAEAPFFQFDSTVMQAVCVFYAIIISFMLGKAVSNLLQEKNRLNALLVIGSILFFVSDLMLALYKFADAPHIVDTICLYTYFPAQSLLAHSIYVYTNKEN